MGKINLGLIELTQATEVSSVSGNVDTLSGITVAHTGDTNIHVTSTEKTNLDSLATNIGAISGITSEKVSNWDTAATNSHSHDNKTALDSITGSVGTMAYQDANSYSSATQVNTALGNKANISETVTATTSADYVKMVTTGGTEVKITKASFVEAMADILNNADKGANVDKVTVTGTDGKFGSVNLTNLASVLGVVPNSFCFNKLIKNFNTSSGYSSGGQVVKGWFAAGARSYDDLVISSQWGVTWVMVYYIPYNASGPGGYGLLQSEWSIVDNHFDNCGVNIYRNGTKVCIKVNMGTAFIEVTSLYNHWASAVTVETQYNFDVSGWTKLYPTT